MLQVASVASLGFLPFLHHLSWVGLLVKFFCQPGHYIMRLSSIYCVTLFRQKDLIIFIIIPQKQRKIVRAMMEMMVKTMILIKLMLWLVADIAWQARRTLSDGGLSIAADWAEQHVVMHNDQLALWFEEGVLHERKVKVVELELTMKVQLV